MSAAENAVVDDGNQAFYDKADRALRDLFDKAKATHELHFVMALMPEFRGMQDAGWNTAEEAVVAYDQYHKHLEKLDGKDPMRARIYLDFFIYTCLKAAVSMRFRKKCC